MGYPIIFVHGMGASASIWKKFDIPEHPVFYISFSKRFAEPSNQVPELAEFITEVLKKTGQQKVILVCHSMGGLVARRYLVDSESFHRVDRLILLSTPNLGSIGLSLNWIPLVLIILGASGLKFFWPLILCLIGLLWEISFYWRGVLLLSPAAWALRPNSQFLRELNSREAPEDVKYISVLSDTKFLPHRLVNLVLFREGGDGAVPLSSQRLSARCVPNFSKLDYTELQVDLPHFAIPYRISPKLTEALK